MRSTPISKQEVEPSVSPHLEIDPRSYHVFQIGQDRLLFDRATGTTSALNDIAFDVLQRIRFGSSINEALQSVATENTGINLGAIREVLRELKSRGFFLVRSSIASFRRGT